MSGDVIEHNFSYNTAMERLTNYCISLKPEFFCTLRACTQFIPHIFKVLKHYITLHNIILHYIT